MGNSQGKAPPVLAITKSPSYAIKRLGARHLLLAEAGGAAATGVFNQLEAFLLTFDEKSETKFHAEAAAAIDTGKRANMNMDVIATSSADQGRYLIAAGQDQYCAIYETTGFIMTEEGKLSLNFRPVGRFESDQSLNDGYQKCCIFDRSTCGNRLVTGGSDGFIRVWSVRDLVEHRDPTISRKPLLEARAHNNEVDHVDVSSDGRVILSVGDGKALCWCMQTGKKLCELEPPPALATGFRVRSAKFTPLGETNNVVVVAFNEIRRTSKSAAFLVLYLVNREKSTPKPYVVRQVLTGDSISTMTLSPDGQLTALGSMAGSVAVLDTHEFRPLLDSQKTHAIFVTGIEFLDHSAGDVVLPQDLALQGALPGCAAGSRATFISLSADKTMQVHSVPADSSTPLSSSLLWIAATSFLAYCILWWILSLF